MNQPPFDDVRMRQAVALALDRQEFVDVAARGNAILGTFFTPGIVETQEELAQVPGWRQPKEQDLTEARRLIAEAGYADGFEGSLNTGSSKNGITHAEVLTEQLRQIGIDLKIDPVDTATYHVKTREGTHPMTMPHIRHHHPRSLGHYFPGFREKHREEPGQLERPPL